MNDWDLARGWFVAGLALGVVGGAVIVLLWAGVVSLWKRRAG